MTAFTLLIGSLSFWFVRADTFGNNMVNILISFSTYPDGIFKGAVKFLLYSLVPVGMSIYDPVHILMEFDAWRLLRVLGYTAFLSAAAVLTFYRGLRRYSSGNLMEARM